MDAEKIQLRYEIRFHEAGLLYETGVDKPGYVYAPHRHGWVTVVTLGGSIRLTVDNTTHELKAGDICEIQSNQLHEGVVGPDGWQWLAAWKPDEDSSFDLPDTQPRPA